MSLYYSPVWEYACLLQFATWPVWFFPVFASGLIVIILWNGTFAPSSERENAAASRETTMATSYQGNVTSVTQSGPEAAKAPVIRTIGLADLHRALQLGWEDFKAVPSHAIILCVIYPVLGLVLARAVLGYSVLPLLFPLAAGFALLGPFAALGLYEMSRRRETGERRPPGMRSRCCARPRSAPCSGSGSSCWHCS